MIKMEPGYCFAYDMGGVVGGDLFYVEVLEVLHRFPATVDPYGEARGGYRVLVHTANGELREYFYGWDYVEYDRAVSLSLDQMAKARAAGWPAEVSFLRNGLGIAVGYVDPATL